MKNPTINIKKITPYFLAVILLLLYYVVNSRMYLYGDDYFYSTNLVTGNDLSSISDIVQSQIWHYSNWGGRTVAHSILQLLFFINIDLLSIIAPILLGLTAFFACKMIPSSTGWTFLAACSSLVAFSSSWLETMLWKTGIANYLIMSFFHFAILCLYYHGYTSLKKLNNPIIYIIIIPLAVFAGWSNENVGPAVLLALIALTVLTKKSGKSCPVWMYIGILFCLAGCIMLIIAPGNAVRSAEIDALYGYPDFFTTLGYRISSNCSAFFIYLGAPLLVALVTTMIYIFVLKQTPDAFDWILLAISIASWGAMILSAHYPSRATFGTMTFLSLYSLRLITKFGNERYKEQFLITCSLFAVAIFRFLEFCC